VTPNGFLGFEIAGVRRQERPRARSHGGGRGDFTKKIGARHTAQSLSWSFFATTAITLTRYTFLLELYNYDPVAVGITGPSQRIGVEGAALVQTLLLPCDITSSHPRGSFLLPLPVQLRLRENIEAQCKLQYSGLTCAFSRLGCGADIYYVESGFRVPDTSRHRNAMLYSQEGSISTTVRRETQPIPMHHSRYTNCCRFSVIVGPMLIGSIRVYVVRSMTALWSSNY
jgi:hypothetical protein